MSPQNSTVSAPKPVVNNAPQFRGGQDSGERPRPDISTREAASVSDSHENSTAPTPRNDDLDQPPGEPEGDESCPREIEKSLNRTDESRVVCHDALCSKPGPSVDHANTSSCDTSKADRTDTTGTQDSGCVDSKVSSGAGERFSDTINLNEQVRENECISSDAEVQLQASECTMSTSVSGVSKLESHSTSQGVAMDVRLTNELNLQSLTSSIRGLSSAGPHDDNINQNYDHGENIGHDIKVNQEQKFYSEAEADSGSYWRSVSFSSPSNSISYDSSQKEVSEASRNSVGVELLMSAERLSLEHGSSKESLASGGKFPFDQCRVDSIECMLPASVNDALEDQSLCFSERESLQNYVAPESSSANLENSVPSSNCQASAQPSDSALVACASHVQNGDQPKLVQASQMDQLFSRNSDDNASPRVAVGECAHEVIAEEINRVRKRSRRRRSSSLLGSCWLNRRNVLASTWRRFLRWCGNSDRRPNEPTSEARQNPSVRTLSRSVCKSGGSLGSADAAGIVSSTGKDDASANRHVYADRTNPLLDSPALSMKSFKGAMQAAASMAGKGAKVSPVDESKNTATANAASSSQAPGNSASRKNSTSSSFKHLSKLRRSSSSKLAFSNSSSSAEENSNNSSGSKGTRTDISAVVKAAAENLRSHAKKSSKSKPPEEGVHNPDVEADGEIPSGQEPGAESVPQAVGYGRGDHMRKVRSRRLMKEFQELTKISQSTTNPVFSVALVNDCLYEWKVKLHRIDQDSFLHRDMIACGVPFILFSMTFPDNFPFHPPFLRVLSPRIEKGFVMEGGAICMELLTPRGWASAYTIEAIIMQLAASLVKGHARISRKPLKDFNQKAAEASFKSLVRTHEKYGWVTPPLADG